MNNIQLAAGIIAALGIALSLVSLFTDVDIFFRAYVFGYLFVLELTLGCLALLMLHYLVNGGWGFAIRRLLEAGARLMPLMAVLFIPLLFGLGSVYSWAGGITDPTYSAQAGWYNILFFIVRAVVYFAIWIGLAWTLTQWSSDMDDLTDPDEIAAAIQRIRTLSAIGIILFFLTTTLATIDWVMSLDGTFFSSIYPWMANSRMVLLAFPMAILGLTLVWNEPRMKNLLNDTVMSDLGKLLLTGLLVWIYMMLMQYIITWSGNLPTKIIWYEVRTEGGWLALMWLSGILHAAAFGALVWPGLKRNRTILLVIAALLVVGRILDMYWITVPPLADGFVLQIWDFTLLVSFAAAWLAGWIYFFDKLRPLPTNHPNLESILATREADNHAAHPAA